MTRSTMVSVLGALFLALASAASAQAPFLEAEPEAMRRQLEDPELDLWNRILVLEKLAEASRTPSVYEDGLLELVDDLLSDTGPCPWDHPEGLFMQRGDFDFKALSEAFRTWVADAGKDLDETIQSVVQDAGLLCQSLGRLGTDKAIEGVERVLRSKHCFFSPTAAFSLALSGDRRYITTISEVASQEPLLARGLSRVLLLFYGREADPAVEEVLGADGLKELLASMPELVLEEEQHKKDLETLRTTDQDP